MHSWRRPSEFAPPLFNAEGAPRLFYSDYALQGVVASPLLNHWLLAACNIVGGDVDILERVFVDTEHADKGFYVVRFYVDDPNSDDDWQVILVDDFLPCGEDGMPCFARCPSPVVLWISIIEKAFAKLQGCYEATGGGSVEDGLLYLTGGLSREVGIAPSADATMKDALWSQMMEWWMSAHVIGCEHRIDSEPSAELQATGLLPNTPYCVVTGGEPMGAGRMVRLRTFHGYSEWKGKWSDTDPAWTSRLRQSLAFSNNGNDGTVWMAFDDFVIWFNVLFICRMADDRWTTLTTKSRWQDETAGGCPPNFATWRNNPQWLLRTSQPLQLTVTLSVPQPPPPPDGANRPLFTPDAAIGVSVITGNAGADGRRRKLQVTSPEELVVRAEPRPVRRLVTQISLEPSETPYLLIPHTYMPGKESSFTMTVRADDVNDDGVADFSLEPVRPETDWHHGSQMEAWEAALARGEGVAGAAGSDGEEDEEDDESDGDDEGLIARMAAKGGGGGGGGAGGPPGSGGFMGNPQISLHAKAGGRFFVFVDQIGLTADGRLEEGEDEGGYPAVGVALAPGGASDDGVIVPAELLQHAAAEASDSVVFACELDASETPYVIMPYLAEPARALASHPQLAYRVSVYADQPFTLGTPEQGAEGHECGGPKCDYDCKNCPMYGVYERLKRMEVGLDRQLKYLANLAPIEELPY